MNNSRVEFHGEGNVIFFDKGVNLHSSTIRFIGDISEKRLEYLKKTLFENMNKNRFFIQNERTKKGLFSNYFANKKEKR